MGLLVILAEDPSGLLSGKERLGHTLLQLLTADTRRSQAEGLLFQAAAGELFFGELGVDLNVVEEILRNRLLVFAFKDGTDL